MTKSHAQTHNGNRTARMVLATATVAASLFAAISISNAQSTTTPDRQCETGTDYHVACRQIPGRPDGWFEAPAEVDTAPAVVPGNVR